MADPPDDRVLGRDELSTEERAALRWAVSTGHPHRAAIAARARSDRGRVVTAREIEAIRGDWEAAGRPPPERHVHRDAIVFADGSAITAVTFLASDPYTREVAPAFGLYLDERWDPPWPHDKLDWPDFGVPSDRESLRSTLLDLLDRAKDGGPVEVGCLGGHGRTGTALACLAVLTGVAADDAVAWVRSNYCRGAVETEEQEAFVRAFAQ